MTDGPDTIAVELLPQQLDFVRDLNSRELLYSGAYGAGKTRSVAFKLAMRAAVPGSREGLTRRYLPSLKATTLTTLLEPDGDAPAILPPGTYVHNKSERTIRIIGGGVIHYFPADDAEKVRSLNLSGCAVDQAEELDAEQWDTLRGRIRLKVDGLRNQLYAACNPSAPSHFLAQRFGLADGASPAAGCRAICTAAPDNWFLPAAYLDDLATLQGVARERYYLGRWVGAEGLIYDRWSRGRHVMERPGVEWQRIACGFDAGYTHPASFVVVGMDGERRLHVLHEWTKSHQLEGDIVAEARRINDRFRPEAFACDPSAATLRAAMTAAGLPVVAANNDVFGGITTVQQQIGDIREGVPCLTVDPACEHLIAELESYQWAPNKDAPVKTFDDAADALRYGVMHLVGAHNVPIDVRAIGGDPDEHDAGGWFAVGESDPFFRAF